MIIGVPKEVKTHEYRVGIIPSGVLELTRRGHRVLIEEGAGKASGITNEEFEQAGAAIIAVAEALNYNFRPIADILA